MRAGTPRGFRDILPREALARERITDTVRACFSGHGYLPVETPLIEDRSTLERAGRIKDSAFQLFDEDGTLLMLRPDLTLPVARLVAGRVAADELPARFRYSAPVVREETSLRGQPRQFTQLGVELVAKEGTESEVEVVRLLAEVLGALEVPAWRIVFGSPVPLTALLDACAPTEEFAGRVRELVHESDLVTLDELIAATPELSPAAARALREVPRLWGGTEVIARLDALLAQGLAYPVDVAQNHTLQLLHRAKGARLAQPANKDNADALAVEVPLKAKQRCLQEGLTLLARREGPRLAHVDCGRIGDLSHMIGTKPVAHDDKAGVDALGGKAGALAHAHVGRGEAKARPLAAPVLDLAQDKVASTEKYGRLLDAPPPDEPADSRGGDGLVALAGELDADDVNAVGPAKLA